MSATALFGLTLFITAGVTTGILFFVNPWSHQEAAFTHLIVFVVLGFAFFMPVVLNIVSGAEIAMQAGITDSNVAVDESCGGFDLTGDGDDCTVSGWVLFGMVVEGVFIYAISNHTAKHFRGIYDSLG